MVDGVTVVTITRGRPDLLRRAIESVRIQRCSVPVSHRIVVDECPETRERLATADDLPEAVRWEYVDSVPRDGYLPARLARLRNVGVELAEHGHVAFLDDDNEFDVSHVESLVQLAEEAGSRAVHSARRLYYRNGLPYLAEEWPWGRTEAVRRERYARHRERGVVSPGSNVTLDRCDPANASRPVRNVDTSEWLFERRLLREVPFPETFTPRERNGGVFEDIKLQATLVANGIEPRSTRLPTLRYYLGGYSTEHLGSDGRSDGDRMAADGGSGRPDAS